MQTRKVSCKRCYAFRRIHANMCVDSEGSHSLTGFALIAAGQIWVRTKSGLLGQTIGKMPCTMGDLLLLVMG